MTYGLPNLISISSGADLYHVQHTVSAQREPSRLTRQIPELFTLVLIQASASTSEVEFSPTAPRSKCSSNSFPPFNDDVDFLSQFYSYDCNDTPAQSWVLTRGSTKVRLEGTNFCLDAGSSTPFPFTAFIYLLIAHLPILAPGNGVAMKLWQCFDDLPAQQWYYTNDNRIALEGQGSFVDLASLFPKLTFILKGCAWT